MSNPNGISSVNDLRICLFFTNIKENGELVVEGNTIKDFIPNVEECIQLPTEPYVISDEGKRIALNTEDVYIHNKNKIIREVNLKRDNIKGDNVKEEKRRV